MEELRNDYQQCKKANPYCVSIFGIKDDRFATENEVVAFGTESDGNALAEEDESEDVPVL